jgi:hypothetical protein
MFHFDCDFGACLFGVFFDGDSVFYICFGPLCLSIWLGGDDDEALA